MGLPANSIAKLNGVHPDLVRVLLAAGDECPQRFIIVQGTRTLQEMYANWGKGRSVTQCQAVGVPIKYAQPQMRRVTWLRDPTKSKHRIMPDGYGHAADVGALDEHGAYDGATAARYDVIAATVLMVAKRLGVGVRWLGDADMDGKPHEQGEIDLAHFELIT